MAATLTAHSLEQVLLQLTPRGTLTQLVNHPWLVPLVRPQMHAYQQNSCTSAQVLVLIDPAVSQILLSILGRSAAKKYLETIKTINKGGKRQSLIKWIEGGCTEIGQSVVGHKVKVWWPASDKGNGCYYSGEVTEFDAVRKDHHIHYDDGNDEDLWLAVESWEDLGMCFLPCTVHVVEVCTVFVIHFLKPQPYCMAFTSSGKV